ncbi:DUF3108 domain-containing protein [Algoriphagus limi]|uniref:DUF3108 domain-containing protein n=1 Tax=Algoriphagus limi TaxID=2975273 RepID=A0ABT2GCC7_9BACT|nr:DUF3108 domain-containing protein [Algoriphagus limi]MCS5491635.1 DUF3108 domain-containing protein [Algoriphagus limi]
MKQSIKFSLFTLILLFSQVVLGQHNYPFTYGEELEFEVSYGWFNLADATMKIGKKPETINEKTHFKIDVYGKTKGAATIFGRVNDNWGSIWELESKLPSVSYRHIEEGKYRKHEKVFFDQQKKKAKMQLFDKENKFLKEEKEYSLPGKVQDIVSGFYYLRTLDLSNLQVGDTVEILGFFDKEIYNIKLIYEGQERIDTEIGEKDTFIFSPQIPKNRLFRGDFPVTVWVTQDQNKIPVKIKANLFLGSLNLELKSASGLRY